MTTIHRYVNMCFYMVFFICLENAVVGWWGNRGSFQDKPELLETIDSYAYCAFGLVWIVWHVFFVKRIGSHLKRIGREMPDAVEDCKDG
jgi:ABC-type uncharacterized transport system permease subunit